MPIVHTQNKDNVAEIQDDSDNACLTWLVKTPLSSPSSHGQASLAAANAADMCCMRLALRYTMAIVLSTVSSVGISRRTSSHTCPNCA